MRSAAVVLNEYDGSLPLAAWLKAYFRQHKKYGSKDRKAIADLCYNFFRLGFAFAEHPVEEQLLIGQFLSHSESKFIQALKPEWADAITLSLPEKLAVLQANGAPRFFPYPEEVSSLINTPAFNLSHLIQPDLFLRIRPGKEEVVQTKLQQAGFSFSTEGDCIRLANTSKVDEVLALDEEAVVQDKSSQKVLAPLETAIKNFKSTNFSAWDCCAASGGKSILLHDRFPKVQLQVSDVRESILHNLRSRFGRAGIQSYQATVADVSSPQFSLNRKFDLIICDAPCSGSGTWGRTPEQLRFFPKEKIAHYVSLQKAIAANASQQLKHEGFFLYITCSVFKKENEEVVQHLLAYTPMQLVEQKYFTGYTEKADTLFMALLRL